MPKRKNINKVRDGWAKRREDCKNLEWNDKINKVR